MYFADLKYGRKFIAPEISEELLLKIDFGDKTKRNVSLAYNHDTDYSSVFNAISINDGCLLFIKRGENVYPVIL